MSDKRFPQINGRYIGDGQWPEKELEGWNHGAKGYWEPDEKLRGRRQCSCCKEGEVRELVGVGISHHGRVLVACPVCDGNLVGLATR
jgi:hypothetical protein